jgi:hypothetical protein
VRRDRDVEVLAKTVEALPVDFVRVAQARDDMVLAKRYEELGRAFVQPFGPVGELVKKRIRRQWQLPFGHDVPRKDFRRGLAGFERPDAGRREPLRLQHLQRGRGGKQLVEAVEADVLEDDAAEVEEENSLHPFFTPSG